MYEPPYDVVDIEFSICCDVVVECDCVRSRVRGSYHSVCQDDYCEFLAYGISACIIRVDCSDSYYILASALELGGIPDELPGVGKV